MLTLDARGLSLWLGASLDALGEARTAIDSLNVFPIADGDTGTNMYLTLESCWEAAIATGTPESLAEISEAVSTAAILGARGNSGVIMAEALRGICSVLSEVEREGDSPPIVDGRLIARALRAASDRARAAVAHPVEGTILTVAEAAAQAAESLADSAANADGTLIRALLQISERMHAALAATTDQLPVLAQAGVVDAGAQGLVVVYDSLLDAVSGVRRRREPVVGRARDDISPSVGSPPAPAAHTTGDFEVMFTCEADQVIIDEVREALDAAGDSLVVSGGPRLWSVHVHVDDAGAAIESVFERVKATHVRISYLPSQQGSVQTDQMRPGQLRPGRGIVAQAHGPGVQALLEAAGVQIVHGRPDRRPATAEILAAIEALGCAEVVVLPSDGDTIPVAEVAADRAREAGQRVTVIPTRSVVQTLAAVAVHDDGARFDDAVVAMADAARASRYGAITIASREALTTAGQCRVGDVLGLVEGDIVEIGINPIEVAEAILRRLLSSGGELVTFVLGTEAPHGVADRLCGMVIAENPGVDVEVIDGGQPLWPLIIGVE